TNPNCLAKPLLARMTIGALSVPSGNCVKITDQTALEGLFNGNVNKIQCLVNKGTKFGDTQCPTISDFADGIDTLKILTEV
ncbi:MAG: hypothetical protein AAF388_16185, partial [Bacteroidota bacterium]